LEEIPEKNQPLWRRKGATLTPEVHVEKLVISHGEVLNSCKSQIQQRVSSIKNITLQQSVARVLSFWTEILNRKLQKTEGSFYPLAGDVL
jgi:hemerythrin-like domain-containing protein